MSATFGTDKLSNTPNEEVCLVTVVLELLRGSFTRVAVFVVVTLVLICRLVSSLELTVRLLYKYVSIPCYYHHSPNLFFLRRNPFRMNLQLAISVPTLVSPQSCFFCQLFNAQYCNRSSHGRIYHYHDHK